MRIVLFCVVINWSLFLCVLTRASGSGQGSAIYIMEVLVLFLPCALQTVFGS